MKTGGKTRTARTPRGGAPAQAAWRRRRTCPPRHYHNAAPYTSRMHPERPAAGRKRLASALVAAAFAFSVALAQVSDPDAVKRRALDLAQAGDYVQARASLERLLSERPDDLSTRKLLARVLIAAGETRDARAHLDRAVSIDAADAEAWSLLGRLHQDAQRFGPAAQALTRAVRLDATDVPALTALANAYVGLDRIDDADETFGRAVKANALRPKPDAEPHASYEIFLLRVNRRDDADAHARRGAALDPGHPLVRDALRALERR